MLREAEHTAFHYRRLRSVSTLKRFHEWGVVEEQRSVGVRPWLAFDFIPGETLAARIAKRRVKYPLRTLLALTDALIPIHRKGYGICDMDDARNVLIERGTGSIKFCDMDVGVAGAAPPPRELDFEELALCARLLYQREDRSVPEAVLEAFVGVTSMVELAGRLRWISIRRRRVGALGP